MLIRSHKDWHFLKPVSMMDELDSRQKKDKDKAGDVKMGCHDKTLHIRLLTVVTNSTIFNLHQTLVAVK